MAGKNLGTLTIDLIAKVGGFIQGMDKAERSSSKWRKQVEKDAKTVGNAIGIASTAVVASLTAMTVATVKQAGEIQKLAGLSGTSSEYFQRYAAGAKLVGIEQEKLSDIFKDVQDKVGDFLQTGGGAMADFFENIAPKVGVTAEQFRKLSGPDALGLYVSSLEKAGASQQEMVFYLEAIASDATALLPLLKDGSRGFDELGQAAADAGAIMSDETIRAATEMSAVIWQAENAFAGIRNQVGTGLLPVLSDLSSTMMGISTNSAIAEDAGRTLGNILKGLSAIAYGAYAAFDILGKGIGASMAVVAAADFSKLDLAMGPAGIANRLYQNRDQIKKALTATGEDLQKTIDQHATVLNGIWEAGAGGDPNAGTKRIADLLEQQRKLYEGQGVVIDRIADKQAKKADAATKSSERQADAIQKELTALERAAKVWGMNADEVKIYDLRVQGASESQLEYAQSLLDTVAAFEKQKELQEDYKSVVESLRTEEEQRLDTLREQLQILNQMGDTKNRDRAIGAAFENAPEFEGAGDLGGFMAEFAKYEKAEEKLNEWHSKQLDMLRELREEKLITDEEYNAKELEIKQKHEDAMAGIERARFQTGLESASSFFGELAALQNSENSKARALGKAAAIAQATIKTYEAANSAYAAMAGIPVVGPALGATAAGAAIVAGMANVAAIKGQAHDGIMSVPSSGTWNLEKGERVLPQDTAARLDRTLADIQYGTGRRLSSGRGGVVVNQTIQTTGQIDRRTSAQMAADTARKTKAVNARGLA